MKLTLLTPTIDMSSRGKIERNSALGSFSGFGSTHPPPVSLKIGNRIPVTQGEERLRERKARWTTKLCKLTGGGGAGGKSDEGAMSAVFYQSFFYGCKKCIHILLKKLPKFFNTKIVIFREEKCYLWRLPVQKCWRKNSEWKWTATWARNSSPSPAHSGQSRQQGCGMRILILILTYP